MSDFLKQILGIITALLTFAAYVPYYRDILRGKTHPHVYTWSLSALLTILIVALQIKGGAGAATYVTAAGGLLCIGVVILGLKHGQRDITKSDTFVAVLALIAIAFWLIADRPIISMILVIIADILAFIPTIRKSWYKPHSETVSLYATNALRFSLALLAVKEYTVLSTLWLGVWATGNGLFTVMLMVRRKIA